MKQYTFILLVLLTACNDQSILTNQPAQPSNYTPSEKQVTYQQQISNHTNSPILLSQHQQENTKIYLQNDLQKIVDQSLKAIAAPIQKDILDIMGTELQFVNTNYNRQRITFQYQVWQINKPSICSNAKLDAMQFSNCTQAAQQLFQEMCTQFQQRKFNNHPRNQQLQRMYCQAAANFKPTIAQISRSPAADNDKLQVLRTQCNDLIFKARISESANDETARDKACRAYRKAANLN